MDKLNTATRIQVISALVEGNSVASTTRMTGVNKRTILRMLADMGTVAAAHHDLTVRGLNTQRVQVDEIWSFVGCKEKTKSAGGQGEGDQWTWTAIDADTKLVVSYLVGLRDAGYAHDFMYDVAGRLNSRVQLTSDGYKCYLEAVDAAFGTNIDYARLIKVYGADSDPNTRYSPPKCVETKLAPVCGNPDINHVSTSFS